MKIAAIASKYLPTIGGGEINTHGILKELAKSHRVTVLTSQRVPGPREEEIDGVRIKRFWNRHNPLHRLPYSSGHTQCPMILRELLRGSYDIILGFPALSGDMKLALWAKRIKGIPVFLMVYDLMDYARFDLSRFTMVEILERFWQPSCRVRWAYHSLDGIFAVDSEQAKCLKMMNERTFFIPVGVDIQEFDNCPAGFREKYGIANGLVILCLGRVCEYKGQDLLLQALPEVLGRVGDVTTVFVGPLESSDYGQKTQKMLSQLGLTDDVIFTGPLPRREVVMALKECDVNVSPSRLLASELVVVETMAARKPVLLSDRGTLSIVQDGIDGFSFALEDRQDLVDKLCLLLSDKVLRQSMGEKGRIKVENEYTFATIAKRVEAHFQTCR